MKKNATLFLLAILLSTPVFAIGGDSYVRTSNVKNAFVLSVSGQSAPLTIGSNDFPGVIRALHDLKTDIGKVTNAEPTIFLDKIPNQRQVVVVGTLGKNPMIDQLIQTKKIDISKIQGQWEHYLIQVVDRPFPNVDKALVIVGSDKRGTIFGIYDVSEQIGVSPWYFWADVPIEHKPALFIKPGIYSEGPSVKYRGIFINDEAPALSGWVKQKYGNAKASKNPPVGSYVTNYGKEFYATIFETLLRMKANYLWPAMWSNAFNEDDPENARLADEYGIVMGTSHQEPMLRSQQEWDRRYMRTLGHWDYTKHPDTLKTFWREGIRRNKNFESVITMGLRGANDSEMAGTLADNIAMVEKIVKEQQDILREEMPQKLDEVPQAWCLYKEIMEYYNNGMRVPDNITLLWADDNWGNIRRLPDAEERKRSGGAGVYYHFDYHGDPRSYEWINTNPLPKIWDQMSLAKQYGADRIWVVNVGHFKGYELPMEYFMNLGWNTERWNNTNINEYTRLWAAREFGTQYASEIADILSKYGKYNGRRKPESLTSTTYSLINYNEFETVVSDYNNLKARAEVIFDKLPLAKRDAFYQIVLFPVKACAIVNELYLSAARNTLYAGQKRATANVMAAQTQSLFQADTALMNYYNKQFANGRWNHFMDQTHLGYTDWMPPRTNSLRHLKLERVQVQDSALLGVALEGSEQSWPLSATPAKLPSFDGFSNRKHYLEIFNRGSKSFEYTVQSNVPWLKLSTKSGLMNQTDTRIELELDEAKLPEGTSKGVLVVSGAGARVAVEVSAFKPEAVVRKQLKGFVESGGYISIEPEHFSKNANVGERKWIKVEDYGRTLSGMRATAPANTPAAVPGIDAPCLEYPIFLFSGDTAQVSLLTSNLLNIMPGRDIRIAVSIDNGQPQYVTNVPDKFKVHWSNPDWAKTVVTHARVNQTTFKLAQNGFHTLKVWMIDPGVVIQKILINTGGLKNSYLGPNESYEYRF